MPHIQIWEIREYLNQVFLRINLVGLAGFDDAVYHCAGLGTFRAVTEQPVLAADGEGTDAVFCQIVVYGTVAVFQITGQPLQLLRV